MSLIELMELAAQAIKNGMDRAVVHIVLWNDGGCIESDTRIAIINSIEDDGSYRRTLPIRQPV